MCRNKDSTTVIQFFKIAFGEKNSFLCKRESHSLLLLYFLEMSTSIWTVEIQLTEYIWNSRRLKEIKHLQKIMKVHRKTNNLPKKKNSSCRSHWIYMQVKVIKVADAT